MFEQAVQTKPNSEHCVDNPLLNLILIFPIDGTRKVWTAPQLLKETSSPQHFRIQVHNWTQEVVSDLSISAKGFTLILVLSDG